MLQSTPNHANESSARKIDKKGDSQTAIVVGERLIAPTPDESMLHLSGIFGIGIDIIEIDRIKKAVERSGERFLKRVFTAEEISYCEGKHYPFSSYAARFAAKEAVLKSMGTGVAGGAGFADVEVYLEPGGAPGIKLHSAAAAIANKKGIVKILISLSHDQSRAIAFAIALKPM